MRRGSYPSRLLLAACLALQAVTLGLLLARLPGGEADGLPALHEDAVQLIDVREC